MAIGFGAALSGCGTLSYLFQAGRGQLSLWNHARPIDAVLKDSRTSPRLARLLSEIPRIKAYGEKMGLKPTSNYTEFVALDRPAVVWVVSASEKLRFRTKEWSFPVVGSFNYLGWFDRKDADRYAAELRTEGWDVDVRGAGAYSTLGWFRDPVLSTMIPSGDEAFGELVNVILHESVHATVYVKGQSYFNESLASFIADRLTPLYLDQRVGIEPNEKNAYREGEKHSRERALQFQETYKKLADLYESPKPESEKLMEKEKLFVELKEKTRASRALNNATVIQFRTYGAGAEEFETLYRGVGGDWSKFLAASRAIRAEDFKSPQQESFRSVVCDALKRVKADFSRAGC